MRLSHRASLAKTLSIETMNCLVLLESFVPPFIGFLSEQISGARLAVKVSPLGGRKHEKLLFAAEAFMELLRLPRKSGVIFRIDHQDRRCDLPDPPVEPFGLLIYFVDNWSERAILVGWFFG